MECNSLFVPDFPNLIDLLPTISLQVFLALGRLILNYQSKTLYPILLEDTAIKTDFDKMDGINGRLGIEGAETAK